MIGIKMIYFFVSFTRSVDEFKYEFIYSLYEVALLFPDNWLVGSHKHLQIIN